MMGLPCPQLSQLVFPSKACPHGRSMAVLETMKQAHVPKGRATV